MPIWPQAVDLVARSHSYRYDVLRGLNERHVSRVLTAHRRSVDARFE